METVVTSAAKSAVCSTRTEELSKPKNHSNDHYFIENSNPEHPITTGPIYIRTLKQFIIDGCQENFLLKDGETFETIHAY